MINYSILAQENEIQSQLSHTSNTNYLKQSIRKHDIRPEALFVQELDFNYQVHRTLRTMKSDAWLRDLKATCQAFYEQMQKYT